MPPYKLYVQCCECPYTITDWSLTALKKGDGHSKKQKHMLIATREFTRHGYSGKDIIYIHPPRN